MRLVPDWKKSWRWFSVQLAALGAVVHYAWPLVPADLTATLPDAARNVVTGLIFFGIIAGRLVDQSDA
jgi:hypothetical protein